MVFMDFRMLLGAKQFRKQAKTIEFSRFFKFFRFFFKNGEIKTIEINDYKLILMVCRFKIDAIMPKTSL